MTTKNTAAEAIALLDVLPQKGGRHVLRFALEHGKAESLLPLLREAVAARESAATARAELLAFSVAHRGTPDPVLTVKYWSGASVADHDPDTRREAEALVYVVQQGADATRAAEKRLDSMVEAIATDPDMVAGAHAEAIRLARQADAGFIAARDTAREAHKLVAMFREADEPRPLWPQPRLDDVDRTWQKYAATWRPLIARLDAQAADPLLMREEVPA